MKKKNKTLWILKMLESSQSVYWPTLTSIRVGERRALAKTFSLIHLRLIAASDEVLVGMVFCLLAVSLRLTLKADGNDFLLMLSFLLSSSEECCINTKIQSKDRHFRFKGFERARRFQWFCLFPLNTRFNQETTKRRAFHQQNQRHITNKDYSQVLLVTYLHVLRQNGKQAVTVFQVHVSAIRFSLYIFCILLQSKAVILILH